jgi:hypothetical protein
MATDRETEMAKRVTSSRSSTGNSGSASNGGFTLTGASRGKQAVGSIRREWRGPREGDTFRAKTHRPRQ